MWNGYSWERIFFNFSYTLNKISDIILIECLILPVADGEKDNYTLEGRVNSQETQNLC